MQNERRVCFISRGCEINMSNDENNKSQPVPLPFTIVIDTREQTPFLFDSVDPKPNIDFRMLKQGDYSVAGFEDQIAVERKTKSDLYGSLGKGRNRFEREIIRLRSYQFAAIVCESDWLSIIKNPPIRSALNPKALMGSLVAWSIRHGVHFIPAPNRIFAEKITFKILERFYRDASAGIYACKTQKQSIRIEMEAGMRMEQETNRQEEELIGWRYDPKYYLELM
jgi:DNA excision repair protein ERCC-4